MIALSSSLPTNPLVLHLEEYRIYKDSTHFDDLVDSNDNTATTDVIGSLFRSGSLQKIYYRLSCYQRYETNSNKGGVSHTFNVQAKHEKSVISDNTNNHFYWSSKIPFEITSKSYKSSILGLNTISLYLTKQSVLYLVIPEQTSITYQQPMQTITTSSNILWSGKLLKTCSEEAIALFIDEKDGGIPKILCSNNEILPFEINISTSNSDNYYSIDNYHKKVSVSKQEQQQKQQDGSKREL